MAEVTGVARPVGVTYGHSVPFWDWGVDVILTSIALTWLVLAGVLLAVLIVRLRPRPHPTERPYWTGLSRSAVQRLRAAARQFLEGGAYPVELREWLDQSTTWEPRIVMRELDLSQSEAFRILHDAGFRPGPHGVWRQGIVRRSD